MTSPPEDVTTAVIEGWPGNGTEFEIEARQRLVELDPLPLDERLADLDVPEGMRFRYAGRTDAEGRAVFRLFAWHDVEPDEVVELPLQDDERNVLWHGLLEWGGPASATDDVARAIGFADVESLHSDGRRIRESLRGGSALTKQDWQRALLATEIVWVDNYYGAALDWEAVSGLSDEQTLRTLRRLQKHFVGLRPARTQRKK